MNLFECARIDTQSCDGFLKNERILKWIYLDARTSKWETQGSPKTFESHILIRKYLWELFLAHPMTKNVPPMTGPCHQTITNHRGLNQLGIISTGMDWLLFYLFDMDFLIVFLYNNKSSVFRKGTNLFPKIPWSDLHIAKQNNLYFAKRPFSHHLQCDYCPLCHSNSSDNIPSKSKNERLSRL